MSEVGLVQMWTQGIGSLLVSTLPLGITLLMLYSLKQGKKYPVMYFSAILLLILVFFVASVLHIISALILIFMVNPLFEDVIGRKSKTRRQNAKDRYEKLSAKFDNIQSEKELHSVRAELEQIKEENRTTIEKLSAIMKSLIFLLGCIFLLQLVLSYPTLPRTTLALKGSQSMMGLVMKRDDDRVMIYDQKSKAIKMVYVDSIEGEDVCAERRPSLHGLGWSPARLTFEYLGLASVPYAYCSE
jgi:hypothetical protein